MPSRVLHVELGRDEPLPFVPAHYSSLHLLARLRGVPIGAMTVPRRRSPGSMGRLRQELAASFAERIWEERLVESAASDLDPPVARPSVSVVVCTRDRADLLDGCLAALSEQDYPSFQVVVVDNAPVSDAVRRVAEKYDVRYVLEPRAGLDLARNRGLASSSSEIVAFTDDDARPDRGWLTGIAAGFSSSDVHAVTGLVVAAELETRAQHLFEDAYGGMGKGFRTRVHSRRGRAMKFAPNALGTGCNMAFRREALIEIGGFDPALDVGTATGGGGDLDALQRILETGNAVVYRPDALVSHLHRRTVKQLRRQIFDNGRAYSAVLTTAFLRARGVDRLRVAYAYLRWLGSWHLRRMAKRLVGRERFPLRLIVAETVGAPCGPVVYALARRRARRIDGQAG